MESVEEMLTKIDAPLALLDESRSMVSKLAATIYRKLVTESVVQTQTRREKSPKAKKRKADILEKAGELSATGVLEHVAEAVLDKRSGENTKKK